MEKENVEVYNFMTSKFPDIPAGHFENNVRIDVPHDRMQNLSTFSIGRMIDNIFLPGTRGRTVAKPIGNTFLRTIKTSDFLALHARG